MIAIDRKERQKRATVEGREREKGRSVDKGSTVNREMRAEKRVMKSLHANARPHHRGSGHQQATTVPFDCLLSLLLLVSDFSDDPFCALLDQQLSRGAHNRCPTHPSRLRRVIGSSVGSSPGSSSMSSGETGFYRQDLISEMRINNTVASASCIYFHALQSLLQRARETLARFRLCNPSSMHGLSDQARSSSSRHCRG